MVTVAYGSGLPAKPKDDKPDFWVPVLRTEFNNFESGLRASLSNAIALGKKLIEAKEKLPHGEFGRLFSDHKDPVQGALPFSYRWAHKIVGIASNEAISNVNHGSYLPPDLNTVYELSLMTAPALEAAIEAGAVRPDMKRAEAKQLVANQQPQKKREDAGDRKVREKAAKASADVLEDMAAEIEEAIGTALLAYPDMREAIADRIQLIVRGLRDD